MSEIEGVYLFFGPQSQSLEKAGIATGMHHPTPIHLQPPCSHNHFGRGLLPVTEAITSHTVTLPMYPELTSAQTQKVVDTVKTSLVPQLYIGKIK